ncbi:alpha/beta hydrolase [Fodinibius salsisoli]|uniref:Alpha/beta fold hydrolase n=1 Tax=Fodinibius salsisoli TaxID=2820877 RepID=A0ABT3PSW8_9BACT|nr:alpha/beta fold hydrolase [Fodinibius salsisoli]MCW9708953.1 alpha/beta fold hydrolase [Fodinibius salsisoli]
MTLFRVDANNPFKGPHQQSKAFEHGASLSRAKAAMIMVHGRGATAKGMFPLADAFAQPDFHYVAPQAENRTWYPYSFLEPKEKNQPGISSGLQLLHDQLESVVQAGIPKEKIILLGFSQGACLATEFAARHPQKLGGIVAFSGGLIGPQIDETNYTGSLDQSPVFMGCSDYDPHIPQERVDETEAVFKRLNAAVNKQIYKGMGHTINKEEIKEVRAIMADLLKN